MKISLKMRFKCVVGVLSFERVKKQKISLKLSANTSEFIDYGLISEYIYASFKQQKFIYLELIRLLQLEFSFYSLFKNVSAILS